MQWKIYALWLALASLLASCGVFQSAGGGNTTETQNTLTAQVLSPNGQPVALARILILDDSLWAPDSASVRQAILDTLYSDAQGKVKLPVFAQGAYTLQIESTHLAALFHFDSRPDSSLILDSVIHRTLQWSAQASVLWIQGSTWQIQKDAQGFSALDLPSGAYWMLADSWEQALILESSSPDTVLLDQSSMILLVDDFEDGSVLNSSLQNYWQSFPSLSLSAAGANWQLGAGLTVAVKPALQGLALCTKISAQDTIRFHLLNVSLSDSLVYLAWNSATRLQFSANGSGVLRVLFASQNQVVQPQQIYADFSLQSSAETYRMGASAVQLPWVREMLFTTPTTAEFCLDDLSLLGLSSDLQFRNGL